MNLNYIAKVGIKSLIRKCLCVLWILPIKNNRIVFESFVGKQISCNPYYIYRRLCELNKDYDFIWVVRKETQKPQGMKNARYVLFNTFMYVKALLTAKCIISNAGLPFYVPFRKNQILINTWHGGGAYKKIGSQENDYKTDFCRILTTKQEAKNTTYFLSSSEKFTEIMSESNFVDKKKYLPLGMPRNDMFFDDKKQNKINQIVRNKLGIDKNVFIVLFAPTFRGAANTAQFDCYLDVNLLKTSCQIKFKREVNVLFRGHHTFNSKYHFSDFDRDVSKYIDMQELLCMADMLITDYSSTMWDFSFTAKPCFLFTPDIDSYLHNRGFYTSPETWGFPIAKTNMELTEKIKNFDEKDFANAMEKHHLDLGNYENGKATEKLCNLITGIMQEIKS